MYNLFFFLLFFTLPSSPLNAKTILSTIYDRATSLFFKPRVRYKSFKHTRSFIQQTDNWSCAMRALAHIHAFEKALLSPNNFEQVLKKELQDETVLHTLYKKYGATWGQLPCDIYKVIKKEGLAKKVMLFDIDYSLNIYCPLSQKNPKTVEDLLTNLIAKSIQSPTAVYTMVGAHNHALLFAFIKIHDKPTQLYLIDSLNIPLDQERETYISLFLPYLTVIDELYLTISTTIKKQFDNTLKRYLKVNKRNLLTALRQPYRKEYLPFDR